MVGGLHKSGLIKNTILQFIQLRNLLQNLSMGNFSKLSKFSKFALFYKEPIGLTSSLLMKLSFLKIKFFIKNEVHMLISS